MFFFGSRQHESVWRSATFDISVVMRIVEYGGRIEVNERQTTKQDLGLGE